MRAETYWVKTSSIKTYPALHSNLETDIVIIGAGLTGILSAYLLAKEGKKVVILEKSTVAEGATHLTTAFLTEIIDTDLRDLISLFGEESAALIAKSHRDAIDLIEKIVLDEKLDCGFKRCIDCVYVNSEDQFKELLEEYEASKDMGIKATLSQRPFKGFLNFGYMEVYDQAKFHPLKFIEQMLPILERLGVQIYEKTTIKDIVKHPCQVKTEDNMCVKAEWIIAATYEPFGQPMGLFFKKGMYTSYIIQAEIAKGVIPENIYEDMDNPYHYFRIDPLNEASDSLILGGEDNRSDIPIDYEKTTSSLEEYLKKILGDNPYAIINGWDGPVLEPADGLALIGQYKNPHLLYAFGFSGNGMTYAGIAGRIITEEILGNMTEETSKIREIYKTSRTLDPKSHFRKALDYGEEFIHGAAKNLFKRKK